MKASTDGEKKFSVSNENTLDNEDEIGYNAIKWATDNGILTADQMDYFYSRFSAITANLEVPEGGQTKSGEYMIPIADNSREGIQNAVVFASGTLDNPIITAVVEIDADNETKLSELRRQVYETERRGIQQKTEGIFRRYNSFDFTNSRIGQRGLVRRNGYYNRFGADRGTSGGKARKAVSYRTTEEGHKVYYSENDIAPTKASSNNGVFFDAENKKFSLSADSNTNTNGAVYNGKEFGLGVADLNGNIEQTWTCDMVGFC